MVKAQLPSDKALIGFAGGPWTLATYMIAKHDMDYCRRFAYQNPQTMEDLMQKLYEQVYYLLCSQIEAGVDAVQLFDSWAYGLPPSLFGSYIQSIHHLLATALKERFPKIKFIAFPRGAGAFYEGFTSSEAIDCIGLDYGLPLPFCAQLQEHKVIQGNLDPQVLLADKGLIATHVDAIFEYLDAGRLIFNLGHGIHKETPRENVEFLVEYVRTKKSSRTL